MNSYGIIENYYRLHRDELLAFAGSRLGGDVALARDMVQELFLRLLQGQRPISAAGMPSLAVTMLRHLLADHYRRRYYRQLYARQQAHTAACLHEPVEPAVYAREALVRIERRLDCLPQSSAEIYRMHLYGGMKVSEISQSLHLDYKAVEYRLGLARREVRRLFKKASAS